MSIANTIRRLANPLLSMARDALAEEESHKAYEPTPLRAMREITNAESFGSILPYTAFHEAEALFVLDTGERDTKARGQALGFTLELTPQTGANEEMTRVLAPIFSSAPTGSNIQVSLYGSPNILEQLKTSALIRKDPSEASPDGKERRSKNIYRVLARKRIDHFLKGTAHPPVPHLPMLIRNFRCILTVVHPCDPQDQRAIDNLVRFRDATASTLRAANFSTETWDAADLINWCAEVTNPQKYISDSPPPHRSHDSGRLIRHQIVDPDTICRPTDDGKSLRYGRPGDSNEIHSRLYTVTGYPAEFPLWSMGNLIGDFYQSQFGYPCPFLITMGAHIVDPATSKSIADVKAARATTNSTSPMARFMPEFQDKKRDWDIVKNSYQQGQGEVDMYHQVLLMGSPKTIEASENSAKAIWRSRGFELVTQQYMQVPGILTSLPMGFTPTMHRFYKRTGLVRRKTTMNAVNLSPLIAEWKGTTTPVIQLVGRRGQLMAFDLFDSGGNYNFAVAATPGAGKSVLANEIAIGYLGRGAKVFIIDVGRSYEKMCRLLGGEFIEFVDKPDWHICINPFSKIQDLGEDMEILKPLLAQMISPSGTLTDHDRSLIEIAIRAAWNAHGTAMSVTDVASALQASEEPVSRRLADQLFPYTLSGMYGKYFHGVNNVDFSNDFVVLELEELKSKKDLQGVVLFIMMFNITQAMYREDRSRPKVCIIDEAWDLMAGGNSGKFIEEGYRRARKYGGSFGTLTQSIDDYYKNPASQAALETSDCLFLLKQKKESVEQLARSGKLSMDESLKRVITSVKTEQGLYSEIFISCLSGSGIGRLIVDPFTLLLYSSSPDDWKALEHYRRQGLTVAQAIDAVLADRSRLRREAA